MNVTMEKTSQVSGCITVEVQESDYAAKVDKDLREIGRTRVIPGFRPGHVSVEQLRRRFGKQVKSDVINKEVYDAVVKYIRENKIGILGEPVPVEVKEINLTDKDYSFQYLIAIAPEIAVDVKAVSIPYYNIEVSREMVETQDKTYRERYGAQVPGETVGPKALVKGGIAQLNGDGTPNEEEDAIRLENGILSPDYFKAKEEADKFMGRKVADKVVFNPWKACGGNLAELASMLNVDKDKAAAATGDFEMTISEIIVVKPAELNGEYFDSVFGAGKVKTEEEYFAGLKEMIASQLASNSEILFRREAERLLVEKFGDFQLPGEILKKWLLGRGEGFTPENIDEEFEKMIPSLKWQLIKERLAAASDVKIEESDVLAHAKKLAADQFAQYGMLNLDESMLEDYAKRMLADKNYRPRIVEEVGDVKLFEAVKSSAKIQSKSVSMEEFRKIAAGE